MTEIERPADADVVDVLVIGGPLPVGTRSLGQTGRRLSSFAVGFAVNGS
jgi:hypothetical protein